MGTCAMTANERLLNALNVAFSRKYHSMAHYILEAKPFVPAGREGALRAVEAIAATDHRFADRVAGVIETLEGVPQLAIFNPEIASLNYLDLNYLLTVLVGELEAQLALFEQAQPFAESSPAARMLFAELVDSTRGQIEGLRQAAA